MELSEGKKKCLKITGITLGSIAGLIVILMVAISIILTPTKLTKLVNKYSNEYLNAEVKIDTVRLKLFSEFPYVGLQLSNGQIISKAFNNESDSLQSAVPSNADTLLKFKDLYISISLPELIIGHYTVKKVRLIEPHIYAYIAPWGEANWEIYRSQDTTTKREESTPLYIDIKKIDIKGHGDLVYESRPDSLCAKLSLNTLKIKGNLANNPERININRTYFSKVSVELTKILGGEAANNPYGKNVFAKFSIDSLRIEAGEKKELLVNALTHTRLVIDKNILAKDIPLEINGSVSTSGTERNAFNLKEMKITMAKIPIVFNGNIKVTKDSIDIPFLCGKTDNFDITEILSNIPEKILPDIHKFRTNAKLFIDVDIEGSYNFKTGILPSTTLEIKIPSSTAEFKGTGIKINEIAAEINANYLPNAPSASIIEFTNLSLKGNGLRISGSGSLRDYMNDPNIIMDLTSHINADTLAQLLPKNFIAKISGSANANLKLESLLSNLTNIKKLGDAEIDCKIKSKFLDIDLPKQEICCQLIGTGAQIGVGERQRATNKKIYDKLITIDFDTDSANIKYGHSFLIKGNKIVLNTKNPASILDAKPNKIVPLYINLAANRFSVDGEDSLRIRMSGTHNQLLIFPQKGHYTNPEIRIKSDNNYISFKDMEGRYGLANATLQLNALFNKSAQIQRRKHINHRLDSLHKIYPRLNRDSLISLVAKRRAMHRGNSDDEFASSNINFGVDRSIASIIRDLNITGSIKASRGSIRTPVFPLKTSLGNIEISFNTDEIKMSNSTFKLGESIITGTGKIYGIKEALLRRGVLGIDLSIDADTLNLNEIAYAASKGTEYMNAGKTIKDSLRQSVDSSQQLVSNAAAQRANSQNSTPPALIIVPGNISADIKLNVKHGVYADVMLNKVSGELIAKDRCLQINNFNAITSAGEMSLSAFYSTRNKKDLSAGFDMEMKEINVKKLLGMVPSIDTILPMLRSFEGTINSQMAATTEIDEKMNIKLPTMKGVIKINGKELVLMDGETFSEISKKLHFKNKKRNIVDKIAVEALINNNKIEIFPFLMEIDRYRTAISGTQNLDMSFKYHISVLKSPIPFRLGINVTGTPDKFKFRIGRAKYKNANLPVYSQIINDTRMNLRSYIADIFQRGVAAAMQEGAKADEKLITSAKQAMLSTENLDPLTFRDSLMMQRPDTVLFTMMDMTEKQQDSLLYKAELAQADSIQNAAIATQSKKKAKAIKRSMARTEKKIAVQNRHRTANDNNKEAIRKKE